MLAEAHIGVGKDKRMGRIEKLWCGENKVTKELDFSWHCPYCGETGEGCSRKLYRYCPYCGSKLKVKKLEGGK